MLLVKVKHTVQKNKTSSSDMSMFITHKNDNACIIRFSINKSAEILCFLLVGLAYVSVTGDLQTVVENLYGRFTFSAFSVV